MLAVMANAQELSRSQAADLIHGSDQFSKTEQWAQLYAGAYEKGIENGLWTGWTPDGLKLKFTAKGSELFPEVETYRSFGSVVARAQLSDHPIKTSAEVTGITLAPSRLGQASVAQFTWRYIGLPLEVRRYVVDGGSGEALIRMYDDGWRLEKLNFDYSEQPALSSRERAQIEAEEQKALNQAEALIIASYQGENEDILSVQYKRKTTYGPVEDYTLFLTANFILQEPPINFKSMQFSSGMSGSGIWMGDVLNFRLKMLEGSSGLAVVNGSYAIAVQVSYNGRGVSSKKYTTLFYGDYGSADTLYHAALDALDTWRAKYQETVERYWDALTR